MSKLVFKPFKQYYIVKYYEYKNIRTISCPIIENNLPNFDINNTIYDIVEKSKGYSKTY